jgi:putative glutamine amidotransferase
VTVPFVLVAPHTRALDTPLGTLEAALVYDAYAEKIARAGGEPLIAGPRSLHANSLLDRADAVLLIGGGDVDPRRFGSTSAGDAVDVRRDDFEVRLVLGSRDRAMPLLGVCRGAQVLNVALGGTLREIDDHRQDTGLSRPSHSIAIDPSSGLSRIVGAVELKVNSFHRWGPEALGEGLRTVARSEDGAVEAIEATTNWWALGVQWHAELLAHESSQRLFDAFVSSVERRVTSD